MGLTPLTLFDYEYLIIQLLFYQKRMYDIHECSKKFLTAPAFK